MATPMQLLRELAKVDRKLDRVLEHKADLESGVVTLQEKLDAEAARKATLTADLNSYEEQRAAKEEKLDEEQTLMKRLDVRLNVVKNMREQMALQREMGAARRSRNGLDRELTQIMERMEEITAELEGIVEREAGIQEMLAAKKAEAAGEIGQFEKHIAEFEKERDGVLDGLGIEVSTVYRRVKKLRGDAVVGVRKGACLGCFMQLPPQQYNLLMQLDDVQNCSHCNRYIYLETEADRSEAELEAKANAAAAQQAAEEAEARAEEAALAREEVAETV